ncbi:MAG: hypothetical protein KDB07_11615 [Planctomycetes bacterium]|nr:hypothetical protein [Planctomycetota bacterium]
MEIFINGQSGLVSADDDVSVEGIHAYLQQELAKQGLIIQAFVLDGEEVFFDVASDVHGKNLQDYKKLEVQCAPAEQIAWDILTELEDKPSLLGAEAAKVTEELQTGKTKEAHERLVRFSNSISYIINGISGANGVIGSNLAETLSDDENERLAKVGEYLTEIDTAIRDEDFTTVGDVLEFDLAPALQVLTAIISRLKADLAERAEGGASE